MPGNKKTPPKDDWTAQEKWVYEKLCAGEEADFNNPDDPKKEKLYGKEFNPKKDKLWTLENENAKNRILSPEFLETILLDKLYKGALHRKGIRIIGAWFTAPIDLSFASIEHQLLLNKSRFDADVNFPYLKSDSLISFEGSNFNGALDLHRLNNDGSLFMRGGAEFGEVDLGSAKIGGTLEMDGSKFHGKLYMNQLQVNSSLFMRRGAEFGEVNLGSAKIGGTLDMDGSKFTGELDMNQLQVDNSLFMRGGAEFDDVILRSAKIGGTLEVDGSKFTGKLAIERTSVNETVFMRKAVFEKPVKFYFSKIGGDLDITDTPQKQKLPSMDLTATEIKGELRLGSRMHLAQWKEGAKLILRNTSVGTIQDLENFWPDELELRGFTYSNLGGFEAGEGKGMAAREASQLIKWLEKQKDYSPQPYEQLAKVLRETGHKEKANEILYASKQKERQNAKGWRKLGMWLLEATIGYGYYPLRSLISISILTLFGAFLLWKTGQGIANGMPYGISYSFDMLLPIIELNKAHYSETIKLTGIVKYCFYFHKLAGWVLATIFIAGLSGITKK